MRPSQTVTSWMKPPIRSGVTNKIYTPRHQPMYVKASLPSMYRLEQRLHIVRAFQTVQYIRARHTHRAVQKKHLYDYTACVCVWSVRSLCMLCVCPPLLSGHTHTHCIIVIVVITAAAVAVIMCSCECVLYELRLCTYLLFRRKTVSNSILACPFECQYRFSFTRVK